MRRLGYRALALLTVASVLLLSPGRAAEQPETEFDGYLVRLSDPREWNGPVLLSAGTCEEVSDGLYRVEDLETAQAMDQLGMAEYYEPNYRLELLESGSYMPAQWNLLTVHAQTAWEHTDGQGAYDMRGTGVTVAVIDSGVYREHPDFKQEHILDYYDLAGTDDGVDVWHGTFVAGVIAAQVNNALGVDGVAPDVTILPICVTKNGGSDTALLIQAIDYAVKQGVDVINLSIGGKYGNESLKKACQDAVDAGILVIAAAGNYKSGETKSSACYMYPASYDGVVSVSACKQDGETVSFDSSYSYFNDRVTVAAPGTGVQSLYLDGGTATKQGTSFAAPVVTAMAAMAKQRSRAIAPETFAALLCGSAVDLGEAGYDLYYGFGLADIAAFAGRWTEAIPSPIAWARRMRRLRRARRFPGRMPWGRRISPCRSRSGRGTAFWAGTRRRTLPVRLLGSSRPAVWGTRPIMRHGAMSPPAISHSMLPMGGCWR